MGKSSTTKMRSFQAVWLPSRVSCFICHNISQHQSNFQRMDPEKMVIHQDPSPHADQWFHPKVNPSSRETTGTCCSQEAHFLAGVCWGVRSPENMVIGCFWINDPTCKWNILKQIWSNLSEDSLHQIHWLIIIPIQWKFYTLFTG